MPVVSRSGRLRSDRRLDGEHPLADPVARAGRLRCLAAAPGSDALSDAGDEMIDVVEQRARVRAHVVALGPKHGRVPRPHPRTGDIAASSDDQRASYSREAPAIT